VKKASLADEPEPIPVARFSSDWRTSIDQPEVHEIYREWRSIANEYIGDRVLVGEVVFSDQSRVAPYLRPDELQLAFNFSLVFQPWDANAIRASIDESLAALPIVTWVLENHDVTRIVTRFGQREARAAALLLLALPGPVFIYQGQELGLEEVDLPDEARQDPIFFRSAGARKGRDGCRVPLPWTRELPRSSWLPMPDGWTEQSVEAQQADDSSTLALYADALGQRRASSPLRNGMFKWLESPPGSLVFEREASGEAVVCTVNLDGATLLLPEGEVLLASEPGLDGKLPPNTSAWVRLHR
jgi:alpha-glucosidase